jgi:hypothetical protein
MIYKGKARIASQAAKKHLERHTNMQTKIKTSYYFNLIKLIKVK